MSGGTNRTLDLHGGRLRQVETQEWYNVWSGNPNGRVYGQKGVLCLDYENWSWYANNSEGGGNSWIAIGPTLPHDHSDDDSGSVLTLPYTRQILWFVPTNPLGTGTDVSATVVYRGPTLYLVRWDLHVKVAPTGADLIFDVHRAPGGQSLWWLNQPLRPTVVIGATSGMRTNFDIDVVEDGNELTVDIDQVGSTIAGAQATLILQGTAYTSTA